MTESATRRPYAAAANVIAVLTRTRTRNLPEAINNDFLRIVGVPEMVFGRVLFALQFLGFIDEAGSPTERLHAIAKAPDTEYRDLLAASVREAYRDDFATVDPGQDSQAVIIDAFRRYEPRSQTSRMVMLFQGLCREAGIPLKDAPRERQMRPGNNGRAAKPSNRAVGGAARSANRRTPSGTGTTGAILTGTLPVGVLFGVTEEDVAALNEEDFKAVWTALGTVARARSLARQKAVLASSEGDFDASDEDERA